MKLYNLTEDDYKKIINDVINVINFNNVYFTGIINDVINTDIKYKFIISLFFYNEKISNDIEDIVPVWWEFHTYDDVIHNEYMNDFNFRTFRNMLIDYLKTINNKL